MIDISNNNPISVYPGSKDFSINKILTIGNDNVESSWLEIDCHYGTHIDSPSHHIENGDKISEFPENLMIGKCQVISCDELTIDIFNKMTIKADVVFFKFRGADLSKPFDPKYKAIPLEVAKLLNIYIVGTNYLSIEDFNGDGSVHKELLSRNIWIIESLNLEGIEDGIYDYYCFPLKIETEACPIRIYIK